MRQTNNRSQWILPGSIFILIILLAQLAIAQVNSRFYIREECEINKFCSSFIDGNFSVAFVDSSRKLPTVATLKDVYIRNRNEDNLFLPFLIYVQKGLPNYLLLPLFPLDHGKIFTKERTQQIKEYMFKLNKSNVISCILPILPTKQIQDNFKKNHPGFEIYERTPTNWGEFKAAYILLSSDKKTYLSYFFHDGTEIDPVLFLTKDWGNASEKIELFIPWEILKEFYLTDPREKTERYFMKYRTSLLFELNLKNNHSSSPLPKEFYRNNNMLIKNLLEYYSFLETGGYLGE